MWRIDHRLLPVLALLAFAAGSPARTPGGKEQTDPIVDAGVRSWGAMRAILHDGKTGAVASLDTLMPDANLYAVGALTGLAGEITIVAGQAYVSRPAGGAARTEVSSKSDATATLLVAVSVSRWKTVTVEEAIPFDGLDDAIGSLAKAAGVDTDARFVFVVEGEMEDLHWHVVDGSRLPAKVSSHAQHKASGVQYDRERAPATLLGFYSRNDAGVFTHMGSATHVHCVVEDTLAAGHVDSVTVPKGARVKFSVVGD